MGPGILIRPLSSVGLETRGSHGGFETKKMPSQGTQGGLQGWGPCQSIDNLAEETRYTARNDSYAEWSSPIRG